ncbi:MAG: hypothetical protein EZS28_050905, partial [Streblomastix strix]
MSNPEIGEDGMKTNASAPSKPRKTASSNLMKQLSSKKKDEEAKKQAKVLDEITKEKLFREELEMLSEELDLE